MSSMGWSVILPDLGKTSTTPPSAVVRNCGDWWPVNAPSGRSPCPAHRVASVNRANREPWAGTCLPAMALQRGAPEAVTGFDARKKNVPGCRCEMWRNCPNYSNLSA
jgi:hypothetical protein